METQPDPSPALPAIAPRELVHRLDQLLSFVRSTAQAALQGGDPAEMREALQSIADTTASMADATRGYVHTSAPAPRRVD